MHMSRRISLSVASIVVTLAAAGCGQGSAALSPTGPTRSVSGSTATASVTGSAPASMLASTPLETLTATVKGKSGEHSPAPKQEEDATAASDAERGKPEKGTKGELSGFVEAVGADTLTMRGVIVKADAGTVIRHGNRVLTLADIAIGDHAQARGTMDLDVLVASEIKVERTGKSEDPAVLEVVQGIVSGLPVPATTCPLIMFTVGTAPTITTVTTATTTVFELGLSCLTLADGAVVRVTGVRQLDLSIAATTIAMPPAP